MAENQKRSRLRSRLSLMRPPRKLKFTREGKFFVGITLGVGFAAINTANNLLYLLLGMLLALIVVSGVMSEISLRDLTVVRRLPQRAQVGRAHLEGLCLQARHLADQRDQQPGLAAKEGHPAYPIYPFVDDPLPALILDDLVRARDRYTSPVGRIGGAKLALQPIGPGVGIE